MPRMPFHEAAVSSSSRAAAAASAKLDEAKQQVRDLQQQLEVAPKKEQPPLIDALAELTPLEEERRAAAKQAAVALSLAQAALKRERQRIFARMQSAADVDRSRAAAGCYVAARAEAEEQLSDTREAHAREQRAQQRARQAARLTAAREQTLRRRELGHPWRVSSTRPNALDRQCRAALGVEPQWSNAWRGAGSADVFPAPPRVARTVWAPAVAAATSTASEPEALTRLKERLALGYARVLDTFHKWDVDGDGTVSSDELRQAMSALGIACDAETLQMLFRSLDADATGGIELDELRRALRPHGVPPAPPKQRISLEMPRRREAEIGAESTGAERRAVAALKKALQPALGKVASLVREWDVDGDGKVTKGELRRALAAQCIPIDKLTLDALFRQLDCDGSGAVEFHEIHRAIRRNFGNESDLVDAVEIDVDNRAPRHRPQTASPAAGSRRAPAGAAAKRTESARVLFNKKLQKVGETSVRELLREKDAQAHDAALARSRTVPNLAPTRV